MPPEHRSEPLEKLGESTLRLDLPRLRRFSIPYILVCPALLLMVLIVLYPLGRLVYMSLHSFVLTRPLDRGFVGLQNFTKALADELVVTSLLRTAIWIVSVVSLQFFFGFGLALFLNRRFPLRGVFRALVLTPWATPSAVIVLIWMWLLDGNYGVINDLLYRTGLITEFIPWLSWPRTAFTGAILAAVWYGIPFFTVMLLAALQAIPDELYEAARVDGAGTFERFCLITLPLVAPTILITLMLRTIWMANYVDIIYMLTGGGPGYGSLTFAVYIFQVARSRLDFGYASALAILTGTMLLGLAVLYVSLCGKRR